MQWSCLVFLTLVAGTLASVEIMKDITLGFGEALDQCREQNNLTEEIMEEFFHFWREDFLFQHRELGCVIICMSTHFDLLTEEHRLHHDNTVNFINSFPRGEVLVDQLMNIIHSCKEQFDQEADSCMRILHTAECFKNTCQAQDIAPSIEMLMAEFIMAAEANDS